MTQLSTDKASQSELEEYLQGKYPINKDQYPLGWWKVCLSLSFFISIVCIYSNIKNFDSQEHEQHFPILAQLAHDYLSVSATSCACERTFSAAAIICTPMRGGMLPKTMERLVGSQAWLKEDIIGDSDFEDAVRALQNYIEVNKKKKP